MEPLATDTEAIDQPGQGPLGQLANSGDARPLQTRGGLEAHAPKITYGKRRQHGTLFARWHDRETIRLVHARGDLGERFRGSDAAGDGEPRLGSDGTLDPAGEILRRSPALHTLADIKEGLVKGERFDERSEPTEDRHDLVTHLAVAAEARRNTLRLRTETHRCFHGHRRTTAEVASLVRGSSDYAARLGRAAH